MDLLKTVNGHLVHKFDGMDYLVRDKNAFHARDASVVYNTSFSKKEIELRKKHNLATKCVEGKCLRALFYDFQKQVVTNPIEADGIRTMDIGSACEACETGYYKDIGIFHSSHIRMFSKDYLISGELDNLVWEYDDILLPDGQPSGRVKIREPRRLIGVEIKSFYGYYAEKEILTLGKPKVNHMLQSLVYLEHYKPNIPYWLLVYLSRSGGVDTPNGRMFGRQFKIQISKVTGEVFVDGVMVKEYTIKDVMERFKEARKYVESNTLPERDYVYNFPAEIVEFKYKEGEISKKDYSSWKAGSKYISDWECSYCPYLLMCWKPVYGDKVRGARDEIKETKEVKEDKKTETIEE